MKTHTTLSNRRCFCSLALLFLIASMMVAPDAFSQVVYSYTGESFSMADPPYTTGDRLTGSITLADPLPPFMPPTDIRFSLVDFSFADGVQTRVPGNSEVCAFEVATDAVGNISHWRLFVRESPFPGAGNPIQTLDSNGPNPGPGGDSVGEGPAGAGPCDSIALTFSASNSMAGSWTSTAVPQPTPTDYTFTGEPFTQADPPYSIGDRTTGSITLAAPLPPFMQPTDLTYALDDFSFTDGVQTRVPANTNICTFEVATDAVGNISHWNIRLRQAPFPGVGNPVQNLDSTGPVPGPGGDLVGEGPAEAVQCDQIFPTFSASNHSAGSWTSTGTPPATPTDYTYAGEPFTFADPPYSIGDRMTGSITLVGPLPPFMPMTNIIYTLDDFTFTDGVQTRIPTNTNICAIEVATDGAGDIVHWRVNLRQTPFPGAGNPVQAMDTVGPFPGPGGDTVGEGPAGAIPCDNIVLSDFSGGNFTAGSWTSPGVPNPSPTDYIYTGEPFTYADPPYSLGDRLTGGITLAGPLPPDMPLTDITLALEEFSFTDGVQTRVPSNTNLCAFQVATDGAGDISDWYIYVRETPFPGAGNPVEALDSFGPSLDFDQVGAGPADSSPCGSVALTYVASSSGAGSWVTRPLVTEAIPALSRFGIALLVMLLGIAAFIVLRGRPV